MPRTPPSSVQNQRNNPPKISASTTKTKPNRIQKGTSISVSKSAKTTLDHQAKIDGKIPKSHSIKNDAKSAKMPKSEQTSAKRAKNYELLQQLQSVVDNLVSQLAREKLIGAEMETKVRDEIFEEHVHLHRELARRYSDQKREAIDDVESLLNCRVNLIKQFMQCDGSTDTSTVSLQATKASTNKFEETIHQIEDLEHQMAHKDHELAILKNESTEKDRRIHDLEMTLEEAGQTFERMEAEIEELKDLIEVLKGGQVTRPVPRQPDLTPPHTNKPLSTDSGVRISSPRKTIPDPSPNDSGTVEDTSTNSDGPAMTIPHSRNGPLSKSQPIIKKSTPIKRIDFLARSIAGDQGKRRRSRKSKRVSLKINHFNRSIKPKWALTSYIRTNRAYQLRMDASPAIVHNHDTGSTHEMNVRRGKVKV